MVFSLTVSYESIVVERVEIKEDYYTELLEQHLIGFLTLQAE
ncbi:hypothetical protein [Mucilaginibacter aquariorum]|uniref:Uncharacterized protein n=1 Tax=Mucilaginibacter aquariorum TaxID=2967225 RepID=A0ABT1T5A3_9SPHI|nr:hypothetical protein [Mucilaginibacter aquariorum]MCQ6959123.1 hypothetical protein [Mucilaginibacter aquariorum]